MKNLWIADESMRAPAGSNHRTLISSIHPKYTHSSDKVKQDSTLFQPVTTPAAEHDITTNLCAFPL